MATDIPQAYKMGYMETRKKWAKTIIKINL